MSVPQFWLGCVAEAEAGDLCKHSIASVPGLRAVPQVSTCHCSSLIPCHAYQAPELPTDYDCRCASESLGSSAGTQ